LVRSDYGPVDDGSDIIVFELQLLEYELPNAPVRPVGESVVDRLPGTEALRQITPGDAGFRAIEDRIDELSIADLGLRPLSLLRQ
jgi:hypothetical protein